MNAYEHQLDFSIGAAITTTLIVCTFKFITPSTYPCIKIIFSVEERFYLGMTFVSGKLVYCFYRTIMSVVKYSIVLQKRANVWFVAIYQHSESIYM